MELRNDLCHGRLMQEFACRRVTFLRCGNPMYRENIGDALDYPYCEDCQTEEDDNITRLDNGGYP